MQQQLIEQTIEIVPATMNDVLAKLTQVLSQHGLQENVLKNAVKSIFYGLWNFDKMINQHNLSTNLAAMLTKLPKKNAFVFLKGMLLYLTEKWNLIDHHRINKFMQLARYLIKSAMKISHKKTDQVLMESVFQNIFQRSGIVDHVVEVYFDCVCEVTLTKDEATNTYTSVLPSQKLEIFEKILANPHSLEYVRLHIMERIYEKYKTHILELELQSNPDGALGKIDEFNAHLLELAKNIEDDHCRKNIYTLIGFMKSDQQLFSVYMEEKIRRQREQKEKRSKKITKGKKAEILKLKQKRKEKKQKEKAQGKNGKVLSRSKFQFTAREHLKKFADN